MFNPVDILPIDEASKFIRDMLGGMVRAARKPTADAMRARAAKLRASWAIKHNDFSRVKVWHPLLEDRLHELLDIEAPTPMVVSVIGDLEDLKHRLAPGGQGHA